MVLNICNFIQRTEQVPIELDISAIEYFILLLLLLYTENANEQTPNYTNIINM